MIRFLKREKSNTHTHTTKNGYKIFKSEQLIIKKRIQKYYSV
jgi:hypothetical protein